MKILILLSLCLGQLLAIPPPLSKDTTQIPNAKLLPGAMKTFVNNNKKEIAKQYDGYQCCFSTSSYKTIRGSSCKVDNNRDADYKWDTGTYFVKDPLDWGDDYSSKCCTTNWSIADDQNKGACQGSSPWVSYKQGKINRYD